MDASEWMKRLNHEDDTSLRNNWALQRVINTAKDVFTNRCDMSIWLTDVTQLDRQLGSEFLFYVIPHTGSNMDIAPYVKEFMNLLKMEFETSFKPRYKVPDKPAYELFSTTHESDLYIPAVDIIGDIEKALGCRICVPYDYYAVPEYIVFTTETNSEIENMLHIVTTGSNDELCSVLPYHQMEV